MCWRFQEKFVHNATLDFLTSKLSDSHKLSLLYNYALSFEQIMLNLNIS
jgi:hypothetical protein